MSHECDDHGKPGHVCSNGPSSFAQTLDEVEFNRSIHAACISNNLERVRAILSKKQSWGESAACAIDSAGYTALHYSSRAGNKDICTELLNAGADIDAKTPELRATPLMRAIQQGHLDVVRLLVSYGADLGVCNSDQENIFHVLAIAATKDSLDKSEKAEVIARWLLSKLDKERRAWLLNMYDAKGCLPVDCVAAAGAPGLEALLTPPTDS